MHLYLFIGIILGYLLEKFNIQLMFTYLIKNYVVELISNQLMKRAE